MEIEPIARAHSVFEQRFGTPRQPGLVPQARARIMMCPPYDQAEAFRGLAGCSHVWLIFGCHLVPATGWSATVRPPRLGGNQRVGVFATRSPFRPNRLGQSAVELVEVYSGPDGCGLVVANHDLVDGTPIYDIRPYLPYSDAITDAIPPPGFEAPPASLTVRAEPAAERVLAALDAAERGLILDVLAADPRPAVQRRDPARSYGVRLAGREIRWMVVDGQVVIQSVTEVDP